MVRAEQLTNAYEGRRILVTGGLGFLGSNLALALADLGADVTVLDSLAAGCGGDPRNIVGGSGSIRVVVADIACADAAADCLRGCDAVFNLAAEIAHTAHLDAAARDLSLNVQSQLEFLAHCVKYAPGVRVVYTSTRQVYGIPQYLPVDEKHTTQPLDFNGVHKLAASQYHLLLWRMGQLDSVVLNLTNIYGPRIALHLPQQGFLANFLARALRGDGLEVFGDGEQLRDPLYVTDAVRSILHAGAISLGTNRVFNIGNPETHSILDIARLLSKLAGLPEPAIRPFPAELRPIDVGSYATDVRHAEAVLGWRATVSIEEGLANSLRFYGKEVRTELSRARKMTSVDGQELIA
ncbi:MAG: NAD-dependent epimerase/dehydratase family protein [Bryobacterales bacterium]|nr:NAD-dependent epimerase/dehydratase family protein [Bryobacterales bacterium]